MIDKTIIDNLEQTSPEVTEDVSNDTISDNTAGTDNNDVDSSTTKSSGTNTSSEAVSSNTISTDSEQQRNDDLNYRAMRKAKKQAEMERDELATKIKELNSANKNSISEDEDVYEDDTSVDDISKTRRDIQELKRQWTAQQNQVKTQNIEQKLKSEFPDLEAVVNEDNIDTLKARDPSFAKIINRAPSDPDELYHRAVAAYTLIKKYGIHVTDNHAKDRARVEKNMAKPRPATASSSSSSEGLSDFANFAGMNEDERRNAIFKLARERANS